MRARALILLAAVPGCDSILRLDPIKPVPQQVAYRKPITITNSSGTMLADQPVSVYIANDMDLHAHSSGDGSDFAFDDGANPLAYEVVEYTPEGTLDAWVRLPSLPPGTTTIYLDYGGGAAPMHDATQTWPDAYVGVWHLADTGATTKDSTRHAHQLTAQTSDVPSPSVGVAGEGHSRKFDATHDERMAGGDSDLSLEMGAGVSFTYGLWVDLDALFGSNANLPLHKGASSSTIPGFDLELTTQSWYAYLCDGTVKPQYVVSNTPLLGRWVELRIVVDRAQGMLLPYIDGALATARVLGTIGPLGDTEPFSLGAEADGNAPFNGLIDEVRVTRGVLTAEQIAFEHANLADRSSVIAVGAEEPVSASP